MMCKEDYKKGPFQLEKTVLDSSFPEKVVMTATRHTVTTDVRLTIFYRSFWTSYCYNGGALDPNTGCENKHTQNIPTQSEAMKWIDKGECAVGSDCKNCWGSDAQICLNPAMTEKKWYHKKELSKDSNNNHFPFHTCNLSWRCGMIESSYPTFLENENDNWIPYTEYANGTRMRLDYTGKWEETDKLILKTGEFKIEKVEVGLSCFYQTGKTTNCYDKEQGNFIEIKKNKACQGRSCYSITPSNDIRKRREIVNLRSASIEDLRGVVASERMLNEELHYNMGKLMEELAMLKNTVTTIIESISKIDDQLIGKLLNTPSKSNHVADDVFFLIPCTDVPAKSSNCYKTLRFTNGRWNNNTNNASCSSWGKVEKIQLFKSKSLWLGDVKPTNFVGTSADFSGWSSFAKVKADLENTLTSTEQSQTTTSLADIMRYPKGFIDNALTGMAVSQMIVVVVIIATTVGAIRNCVRNKGIERRDNLTTANIAPVVINMTNVANKAEEKIEEKTQTKTQTTDIPLGII